jgi:hypothetical protein
MVTLHAAHMNLRLQVDGSPFHFAGFNNYYMPTYAADPNLNERIKDVDVVFQCVFCTPFCACINVRTLSL